MQSLVRLGIALLALVVAAVVGAIATFAHAQTPPWFLIGGLLIVAALVLGVRLAVAQPLATAAAALGVVGATLVLALLPGDEIVVVAGDGLGTAWLIGVVVVVLGAALWPIPRRPEAASESP
ncbi:MAG: hypothetical protein J0H23_03510 [Micrococcales bacterium]|nr:hypothetical protein [Micrococcales bacterium]OJX66289.1 MAG: hypothetical protein BGO94_05175 [Micrococcales bacterium 72-143]